MTIRDEVDQAMDAYHGDDLQFVTVGFDRWIRFAKRSGSRQRPTIPAHLMLKSSIAA